MTPVLRPGSDIPLDFSHFCPDIDAIMWRAGLYNIDVSDWSPDDFKEQPPSYTPPKPKATVEAEPRKPQEQLPLCDDDDAKWVWSRSKGKARAQVEPRKPRTEDDLCNVDVSNWLDTDFQALTLAGPEPMATGETEPRKPQTQDDLCDVDVSNWMEIDFANPTN